MPRASCRPYQLLLAPPLAPAGRRQAGAGCRASVDWRHGDCPGQSVLPRRCLPSAWTRLRCGSACHRATRRGSNRSSRPAGHLTGARGSGAKRSWKQVHVDLGGPRKSWNGGASIVLIAPMRVRNTEGPPAAHAGRLDVLIALRGFATTSPGGGSRRRTVGVLIAPTWVRNPKPVCLTSRWSRSSSPYEGSQHGRRAGGVTTLIKSPHRPYEGFATCSTTRHRSPSTSQPSPSMASSVPPWPMR